MSVGSLAWVVGVGALGLATGAGAVARNTIGFAVVGGMLASTSLAIFIVPVLYVIFTHLSYGKKQLAWLQAHHEELMEKARRVEQQNIDPELEYEIAQAHPKGSAGAADPNGESAPGALACSPLVQVIPPTF